MPPELAAAAYEMIHGRFTDEQRKGVFKPEVPVPADASPQARLLAYTGRQPDSTATTPSTAVSTPDWISATILSRNTLLGGTPTRFRAVPPGGECRGIPPSSRWCGR